jgi:hypothetical protein
MRLMIAGGPIAHPIFQPGQQQEGSAPNKAKTRQANYADEDK